MAEFLEHRMAGERVTLWADRALGWPAGGALFIADPHLGKAAAFRSLGVAAPDGTEEDLARISRLLAATGAGRLVILGDFYHSRSGLTANTRAVLEAWRCRHPGLEVVLVRGNHDRGSGDPAPAFDIRCVEPGWELGPFVCLHEPAEAPGGYALCGHVHPGLVLRERNGARLRMPCFVAGERRAILPAFGRFTGISPVQPATGDRWFAVGEGGVVDCGGGGTRTRDVSSPPAR